MGVREAPPLGREPVDVRRADQGGAVATEVSVPEIVGVDQDDVGQPLTLRLGPLSGKNGEEERDEGHHGGVTVAENRPGCGIGRPAVRSPPPPLPGRAAARSGTGGNGSERRSSRTSRHDEARGG